MQKQTKNLKIILGIILLLILVILISFLVLREKDTSLVKKNSTNPLDANSPSMPGKVIDLEKTDEALPADSEVLFQGRFNNVEQTLSGKALFIQSNGEKTLRFEEFETVNGQDIHVYLSPILNLDKNDVLDLGLLKATSGNFNYSLDKSINIEKYNNVLIWSNTFNAFFGYASLISKELPEILESPTPEAKMEATPGATLETTPQPQETPIEDTGETPTEEVSDEKQSETILSPGEEAKTEEENQ